MLKPDERAPLLELLRPPLGYQLDQAVGTSFSLDLLAAITVPLAFALFDWENKEGKVGADPLALLEALRRYGDRLTIFSHSGQIQLPTKYPPLVPWLEESICSVVPKDPKGVFHPKVWALRFTKPNATRDDKVLYRVLCMSRNLTFDRSWDTVVALDGELTDRERAFADNRPLSEFFAELARLKSQRPLSAARRAAIAKIADELLRVKFDLPDGFETCRFWGSGLGGLSARKCFEGAKQALIVSPFVSDSIIQALTDDNIPVYLVSRTEELQKLNPATLHGCQKVYTLSADAVPENPDEQEETTPLATIPLATWGFPKANFVGHEKTTRGIGAVEPIENVVCRFPLKVLQSFQHCLGIRSIVHAGTPRLRAAQSGFQTDWNSGESSVVPAGAWTRSWSNA